MTDDTGSAPSLLADTTYAVAESLTFGRGLALAGGFGAFVGALLPWLTVNFLSAQWSVRGIDRDGKFTLLMAVVVGVIVLRYWTDNGQLVAGVLGVLMLVITIRYMVDPLYGVDTSVFTETQRNIGARGVNIGSGLYLTLISAGAIVFGALTDRGMPDPEEESAVDAQ